MLNAGVVIVKVRNKSPVLIRSYGHFQHIELTKALRGQAKGIWEIVEDMGSGEPIVSRDRIDEVHNDRYLTRTSFKERESSEALAYKDVYGGEKIR